MTNVEIVFFNLEEGEFLSKGVGESLPPEQRGSSVCFHSVKFTCRNGRQFEISFEDANSIRVREVSDSSSEVMAIPSSWDSFIIR